MAYHLQVCDSVYDLGSREIGENASITAVDLAAIAENMDRAYEIQLYNGVVYELRVWDGEECFWAAHFLCWSGKLNPIES